MLADIGLTVMREIPVQTLGGLLTGAYSLHGGVVRDAGGRIVAHLLSSGVPDVIKQTIPGLNVLASLVGSGQIFTMARTLEEVQSLVETTLTVASAGAALSGIGLVTNVAGTVYLSKKLDSVIAQLARIEALLNDRHTAILRGAVDNLRHAEHASDTETRRAMLVSAKTNFSESAHFYGGQFADAKTVQEIFALEDSFALALTGYALSLSELGMRGAAAADFETHYERWRRVARGHVQTHFLREDPRRLMVDAGVDEVPAAELVAALDFARATQKSWGWIDELRHAKSPMRVPNPFSGKPLAEAVAMTRKLRAKDGVFSAFGEHLRLLDQKRLSASAFAAEAEKARREVDAPAAWLVASV